MRHVFHLQGLDCASCAAKIETAAAKLADVESAVVDFSAGRIVIDAEKDNSSEIKFALQEIVSSIEPHVIVTDRKDTAKPELVTARNILFMLGLLSFFTALFFPAGSFKNGLFSLAYFLAGAEVILQAVKNIRQGQIFDEHFLMSVATIGALAIGEFPEAASVMLFYRTGEFLQSIAVDRSRRSIAALIAIRPEIAHRKVGDALEDIPVEKVRIDDILLVRPGERIPVDGTILAGFSALDTSALTGESMPRTVAEGEDVLAGAINLSGLLTIKARKVAADSTVARILDLVENAAVNKAPTEDFITSFARYYTPVVVGIAVLIAAIPPLFISGAAFNDWFYRALIFLVISCPCALVVSIPLGFFGGIGGASRQGILVKGSNFLQALQEVDTVVFDKTGTLTSGKFSVEKVTAAGGFQEDEVLEMAAFAESVSSHPIARSITEAYPQEIDPVEIESFEELSGLGVRAQWRGREILVGSKRLLAKEGISIEETAENPQVYVAAEGQFAGTISLVDRPKKGAKQAIAELKEHGIKNIVMLTGDAYRAAKAVGDELGIFDVRAELLPEDKVAELARIMDNGRPKGKVAFVGDGVNDAPAIARADVGIAMGALGSEAAIETADVVLMNDEPLDVAKALKTARRTNRIVWQNISLAFAVKLIVLSLGAFGLATLWEAVFADVGVTILAVLNSVRSINPKLKPKTIKTL
ncbi:MAG TPA: cadmium-translocating P-type ATPase [Firmicutes bacterium]|nr:cadmium-translocating P-type ATPase [Bacillota bacterium]